MDMHLRIKGPLAKRLMEARERLNLSRTGIIYLALGEYLRNHHDEIFGQNEKS